MLDVGHIVGQHLRRTDHLVSLVEVGHIVELHGGAFLVGRGHWGYCIRLEGECLVVLDLFPGISQGEILTISIQPGQVSLSKLQVGVQFTHGKSHRAIGPEQVSHIEDRHAYTLLFSSSLVKYRLATESVASGKPRQGRSGIVFVGEALEHFVSSSFVGCHGRGDARVIGRRRRQDGKDLPRRESRDLSLEGLGIHMDSIQDWTLRVYPQN